MGFFLTGGEAHDLVGADHLLPSMQADTLIADKAFDADEQVIAPLIVAGVPERNLYSDTASGKRDDRPGLEACLKALRDGDTLVVWKLDRLGRHLRHAEWRVPQGFAAAPTVRDP